MNQKSGTITINNFYFISPEKFKELINSKQFPLNVKNISNNSSQIINNSPIKKDNFQYKIVKEQIVSLSDKENKNDENIILQDKSKNFTVEIKKEQKPIFLTDKNVCKDKSLKKIGRKPKNSLRKSYHTKYSHDNILRKIKVKFFKKIIKYINNIIKNKYWRRVLLLKPLYGKVSQNNTKIFNRILLYTKLKDIFFSFEINGKFKSVDKEHNKKVIKSIYENDLTDLIEILEMTFLDVFNAFKEKNGVEKLKGLEKLDVVLEEIKNKENDEYAAQFKKVAMNFDKYYLLKNSKNINNKA